jgi:Flp pilus assembly protein TadG
MKHNADRRYSVYRTKIMAGRKISRLQAGRSGSVAIEFGLSLPLLALLFVGVAEIGFTAYQSLQVQNAVEAGIVYAMKNGSDSNGISAAVVNSTSIAGVTATPAPAQFCGCPATSGITTTSCTATCSGGNSSGRYLQINASLTRQSIFPGSGLPLPATLSAKSIVRLN